MKTLWRILYGIVCVLALILCMNIYITNTKLEKHDSALIGEINQRTLIILEQQQRLKEVSQRLTSLEREVSRLMELHK